MLSFSRFRLGLLAAAALGSVMVCGLVFAAKGGGKGGGGDSGGDAPPPVPAGTIYFTLDDSPLGGAWSPWSMAWDGSKKTAVEELVTYSSSNRLYGHGYRWSLEIGDTTSRDPNYGPVRVYRDEAAYIADDLWGIYEGYSQSELFAVASDNPLLRIQLTDFFGTFNASYSGAEGLRWSSDGQDTFVSFTAADWSDAFGQDDQGYYLIAGNVENVIVRLWITGSAMHGSAESWQPVTWRFDTEPDPLVLTIVEVVVSNPRAVGGSLKHAWSPDGTRVAYVQDSQTATWPADASLWIKDVENATSSLAYDATSHIYYPAWQHGPAGQLVFWQGGKYHILDLTVPPTDENYHRESSSGITTSPLLWSHDGRYLVYGTIVQGSMGNDKYYLDRIDVTTGAIVRLTDDLDRRLGKGSIGWFSEPDASAGP